MEENKFLNTAPKKTSGFKKFLGWLTLLVIIFAGSFFWWRYYFVFGEGVKSGKLNYVVKKGNIFKTYEGILIQEGFRAQNVAGFQSNEFQFSVASDSIASLLMNNSGKTFDLHYIEYKAAVPWRGFSPFIVDKIISMKN